MNWFVKIFTHFTIGIRFQEQMVRLARQLWVKVIIAVEKSPSPELTRWDWPIRKHAGLLFRGTPKCLPCSIRRTWFQSALEQKYKLHKTDKWMAFYDTSGKLAHPAPSCPGFWKFSKCYGVDKDFICGTSNQKPSKFKGRAVVMRPMLKTVEKEERSPCSVCSERMLTTS